MDKLKMAHEWFISSINNGKHVTIEQAWCYADAMQAEADKRKQYDPMKKVREQEWQPDWSQAPEWANWWAMDADSDCYWFEDKPTMRSVTWIPNEPNQVNETQPFNYQGDWKDSLRKRLSNI